MCWQAICVCSLFFYWRAILPEQQLRANTVFAHNRLRALCRRMNHIQVAPFFRVLHRPTGRRHCVLPRFCRLTREAPWSETPRQMCTRAAA